MSLRSPAWAAIAAAASLIAACPALATDGPLLLFGG